ncbi:HPX5 [Cordylochernes scorpioides]|uniref:HPX5 n=1 Tax=Cordylochernes scorpioides TaxID=51811 RepID=A0ABY6LIP4_9ARAC|nr:HPX5 [Cordylochernes scorpioides]
MSFVERCPLAGVSSRGGSTVLEFKQPTINSTPYITTLLHVQSTVFRDTTIANTETLQRLHLELNRCKPLTVLHKEGVQGYYDSYNPKVNAAIRNAFQSAAFRFGHSLLPDVVTRYNKFGERIGLSSTLF